MASTKKGIIALGLTFLLFLSNLLLSQQILNINTKLTLVRSKTDLLDLSISDLKVKVSQLDSAERTLKLAGIYGFTQTKNIIYLTDNDFLAKND